MEISRLSREASEMGASTAAVISARDVRVDERALLKCLAPICSHYGVDLMCPPNVPSPIQFRGMLGRYKQAVLVKVDIPGAELVSSTGPKPEYVDAARNARMKLHDIVCRLESLSLERGFYFAAGFIGGACPLCDTCVGVKSGLPCRHPFKARPSMEAVGIDVMATAAKAGLSLGFGKDAGRSWMGLVLID